MAAQEVGFEACGIKQLTRAMKEIVFPQTNQEAK